MIQQFGNDPHHVEMYPQQAIADCFKVVDSKQVDFAVVPFENSTNGQVVYTYDLIRDWFIPKSSTAEPNFKIVAEQFVAIHHNFLTNAKSLSEIKTIYSHPQVWTQVSSFLETLAVSPDVKKIDTTSTSKAAELVHNDNTNTSACISSKMSSELYKLPILYEGVEDIPNNTTRFLVLGASDPPLPPNNPQSTNPNESYVTSIIFTLNHDDPGALCDVLDAFRTRKVSMTSINSRPSHLRQWQYVFFVELVGDYKTFKDVSESIEEVSEKCLDLVVLGSFKRSWRYQSK